MCQLSRWPATSASVLFVWTRGTWYLKTRLWTTIGLFAFLITSATDIDRIPTETLDELALYSWMIWPDLTWRSSSSSSNPTPQGKWQMHGFTLSCLKCSFWEESKVYLPFSSVRVQYKKENKSKSHLLLYIKILSKYSSWLVLFKSSVCHLGKPGITPVFKMASKTEAGYRTGIIMHVWSKFYS